MSQVQCGFQPNIEKTRSANYFAGAVLMPYGRFYEADEVFKQPELARTLKRRRWWLRPVPCPCLPW